VRSQVQLGNEGKQTTVCNTVYSSAPHTIATVVVMLPPTL
jgi:hypothetical protein